MPDTPFSPEYELGQSTGLEGGAEHRPQGTHPVQQQKLPHQQSPEELAIQEEMAALPSGKPYRVVIRRKLQQ